MSQLIETGFKMNYEVLHIRSIKVTPSGDMNGNKYGASVKVKTVNVSQEDDEKYGLIEKETIMEFKIPCEDDQLRDFNLFLRSMQKSNVPLKFTGTAPRDSGKDSFTVTSNETATEIMAKNKK